jgi:hypothetical protein
MGAIDGMGCPDGRHLFFRDVDLGMINRIVDSRDGFHRMAILESGQTLDLLWEVATPGRWGEADGGRVDCFLMIQDGMSCLAVAAPAGWRPA